MKSGEKKTMFIGQHSHTIDEKGRIALPSKFREVLAVGAVVTRGLDGSLFVLPLEEWGKLAGSLADLPLGQANARAFARLMLAGAMDVVLDKQGRCIIPSSLREYAGLKKDVVIIGVNTRLELWDAEVWATYVTNTEKDAGNIAEQLGAIGL